MEIYTEKLACHTLSNWMVGKVVKKISAEGAAPSALIPEAGANLPASRPGLFTGGPSGLPEM